MRAYLKNPKKWGGGGGGVVSADLRCTRGFVFGPKNQFKTISFMPFFIVFIEMTFISCARLDDLLVSSPLPVTTPGDRKNGMSMARACLRRLGVCFRGKKKFETNSFMFFLKIVFIGMTMG